MNIMNIFFIFEKIRAAEFYCSFFIDEKNISPIIFLVFLYDVFNGTYIKPYTCCTYEFMVIIKHLVIDKNGH